MCLFTVQLGKGATVFQHFFLGIDLGQQVGDPDLDATVTTDVQFVTGIDTHHAKVFNGRLGAVARAAGDGQFVLVRHPGTPGEFFKLDAEAGRVLGAEAAPGLAGTGLDGTHGLAIGMAGDKTGIGEVFPQRWQVFFFDAEQINALPAGHFHLRHLVLVAHIGNRTQFIRFDQSTEHARHYRIGAVFLDVAVRAFIDEA